MHTGKVVQGVGEVSLPSRLYIFLKDLTIKCGIV